MDDVQPEAPGPYPSEAPPDIDRHMADLAYAQEHGKPSPVTVAQERAQRAWERQRDRQAQIDTWNAELRQRTAQLTAGAQLAVMQASVAASQVGGGGGARKPDRSTVRGRAEIEVRHAVRRRKRKLTRQLNPRRAFARRMAPRRERRAAREWAWDRGHLKRTPGMQVRAAAHRVHTLVTDPAAAVSALGPAHRTGTHRICTICHTPTDLDRCPLCGPGTHLVDHIACDGCGAADEVHAIAIGDAHTRKCHGKWEPCQGDCRRCSGGDR
jgi:hypothetical protein